MVPFGPTLLPRPSIEKTSADSTICTRRGEASRNWKDPPKTRLETDHPDRAPGSDDVGGLKRHFNQAIQAIMKKPSITEAKNNLSALIDSVKGGSATLRASSEASPR